MRLVRQGATLAGMESPDAQDAAPSEGIRGGVRELLMLLASADGQTAYERSVPIANVPAELLCMWFDDCYHPDDVRFRRAFSPRELEALASLDERYRSAADELKPLPRNVPELHAHPAWGRVVQAASATLRMLAADQS